LSRQKKAWAEPNAGQSQTKETDNRVEMSDNRVMKRILDRTTLENLLHHAALAAQLVGHLDDCAHPGLVDLLGDHLDAVVHGLTELLGGTRAFAVCDVSGPDDRGGPRDVPALPIAAGDAS
jgi:hypothetical protein